MNTTNMGRPRKLTTKAVQQAAVDRRNGMTWKALSLKYECAINTIRYSLAEYSDEFAPTVSMLRPQVEQQLNALQSDMDNIKTENHLWLSKNGVYGSIELKRHYHDGSGIVMEGLPMPITERIKIVPFHLSSDIRVWTREGSKDKIPNSVPIMSFHLPNHLLLVHPIVIPPILTISVFLPQKRWKDRR